ncbi:MAG TPA: peptidoglycan DD-metalloendopeptidase family protein, partial [Caulobacteraceae bacterium]
LTSNGVATAEAAAAAQAAQSQLGPNPGVLHLAFVVSPSGAALRLVSLEIRRADNTGVSLSHGAGDAFVVKALAAQLTSGARVIRSEMDANSFYTSAVAAGVPDTLISPFSNAFTFDFDFQREIKQGDVFEAVFTEQVNERGEVSGAQALLYVSMQTAAKSRALYRYKVPGQAQPGWYDGNGRSVVRSFMRTPVEGARVSSTFGMRMHPVLGFMKMHKGVDFAAPIGTPIYAASAGAVEWAAMKGPNGNLVILKHDNGWQTYYLHMVQIAAGMAPGVRVQQGQQIGQVGMTGRATGPHLHYEVHINGEPVDPMGIPVEEGSALAGADLKAFLKERDRIDALRQAQSG